MNLIVLNLCFALVAATTPNLNWATVVPLNTDQQFASLSKVSKSDSRISNGELSWLGQFPYQVGLFLHLNSSQNAWCGGTLISNQWILTAAHCTVSMLSVDVILGVVDLTTINNEKQIIHIVAAAGENVIVHENYNPEGFLNDISLIKLSKTVTFSENIQLAKLPSINGKHSDYSGSYAFASGWGRISDSALTITDKLRWIKVPILSNFDCVSSMGSFIQDSNICINTNDGFKSVCKGDSGGPLVLDDGSRTIIGITSFGLQIGCEKGWPGVFTRVSSYLDWIEQRSGVVNRVNSSETDQSSSSIDIHSSSCKRVVLITVMCTILLNYCLRR